MIFPTPWKGKIMTLILSVSESKWLFQVHLFHVSQREIWGTVHIAHFLPLAYLLFSAKLSNANKLWFQGESQRRSVLELMDIYFDFVAGGRTQSREYLNNLERNTQLSFLQSLVQVISLTEAYFISGDCCHNVLIKENASLGTHTQSEPKFQTAWICYGSAERILPFSALLISFHQLMHFSFCAQRCLSREHRLAGAP